MYLIDIHEKFDKQCFPKRLLGVDGPLEVE